MREILFRGKRIDDNRWVEGGIMRKFHPNFPHESERDFYFQKENCYVICANNRDIFVAQNTIGQFTGLTDKNGKKIFEGDIVKYPRYGDNRVEYVTYSCEDTAYQFSNGKTVCMNIGAWFNGFELEVIGNIHDNPELLDNSELLEDKP